MKSQLQRGRQAPMGRSGHPMTAPIRWPQPLSARHNRREDQHGPHERYAGYDHRNDRSLAESTTGKGVCVKTKPHSAHITGECAARNRGISPRVMPLCRVAVHHSAVIARSEAKESNPEKPRGLRKRPWIASLRSQ
jgi:hypothetical protein